MLLPSCVLVAGSASHWFTQRHRTCHLHLLPLLIRCHQPCLPRARTRVSAKLPVQLVQHFFLLFRTGYVRFYFFRPTFNFFSWHSCVAGLVGCVIMCFFIDTVTASIAFVICCVLTVSLHLRQFPQTWGSISQALIFHQVFKVFFNPLLSSSSIIVSLSCV